MSKTGKFTSKGLKELQKDLEKFDLFKLALVESLGYGSYGRIGF